MKAVFRIHGRLRQAAPIPRDFLPLAGLESLGLVYQRRVITDPEDFNKTLATINDPRFPNRGANIQPYMLTEAEAAAAEAGAEAAAEAAAIAAEREAAAAEFTVAVDHVREPVGEPVGDPCYDAGDEPPVYPDTEPAEPAAEDTPAPRFTLVDGEVFEGETKIASITETGTLRMAKGYAELREAVDGWLNPPTEP